MYAKLSENYYWLNMKETSRRYATNCSICRMAKAYNTQKQGLLAPLPIPERKWIDLSMDFVVDLPKYRRRNRIYENVLVVVDRLTKRKIYEPMGPMTTEDLLEALHRRISILSSFTRYDLASRLWLGSFIKEILKFTSDVLAVIETHGIKLVQHCTIISPFS